MRSFCILLMLLGLSIQVSAQYFFCESIPSSTAGERIKSISLKDVLYNGPGTCTDYTSIDYLVPRFVPGETVSGTLAIDVCGASFTPTSIKIFIDWDADEEYDANETAFATTTAITAASTVPFSFTVPANVQKGINAQMRFIVRGQTPTNSISICGTYARGETLDMYFTTTDFGSTEIVGLRNVQVLGAPADFDNDGDLDILGYTNANIKIFKNTTTNPGQPSFSESNISFEVMTSTQWIDYNRDGYLDLVGFVDVGNNVFQAHLYTQNPGTHSFTETSLPFTQPGMFGDYDSDGDLDYLATSVGDIYTRQPDGSYVKTNVARFGKFFDYDNDSDLDLIVGREIYSNVNGNFELSHNLYQTSNVVAISHETPFATGGFESFFASEVRMGIEGPIIVSNQNGSAFTSSLYGDYEVSGIIEAADFFLEGGVDGLATTTSGEGWFIGEERLYGYSGNNINSITGDFDNDSRIDVMTFVTTGDGVNRNIFMRNMVDGANNPPSQPSGLSSELADGSVTLKWNPATDDHTNSEDLSYNIVVRRGYDTLIISESLRSGKRKINGMGNARLGLDLKLNTKDLPPGLYSWTVQAIDQGHMGSSFASEGQFELTTGTQPTIQLSATSTASKSFYVAETKEYVLGYIDNGDVFYKKLDTRGQPINAPVKINRVTSNCSDFDLIPGKTSGEIFAVWNSEESVYARRIVEGSEVNEIPIDVATELDEVIVDIAAAYNPEIGEYAVFISHDYNWYQQEVNHSSMKGMRLSTNGNFELIAAQLVEVNRIDRAPDGSNTFSHYHLNASYNADFNVYLLSWLNSWNFDESLFAFGYGLTTPTDIRFALVSSQLEILATSIINVVEDATELRVENQFNNEYFAAWNHYVMTSPHPQPNSVQQASFIHEIKGATVKIGGSIDSPTLSVQQIPGNLSRATVQGVSNTGTSRPTMAFNSKRNEFLMGWSNLAASRSIKTQRLDIVTKKTVLKEELRLGENKGWPNDITFNPDRNEFLISWTNTFDQSVSHTILKTAKDRPPVVTSVNKSSAYAGETITITGDFGKTDFLNEVKFGNKTATVTSNYLDGHTLDVIVPPGLGRTPVPITITFDDQSGTSEFTFESLTLHSITSLDKTEGIAGDEVVITGTLFPENAEQITVKFGDVQALPEDIISNSTTQIKVKVPQEALRGTRPVSVTIQGQLVSSPVNYRVIVPPSITSVEAPDGFISCKIITIKGADFGDKQEDVVVKFGDVEAVSSDFINVSPGAILVKMPIGARGNASISVTIDDRTATSDSYDLKLGSTVSSVGLPGMIELTGRTTDAISMQLKILNQCSMQELKLFQKGVSQPSSAWVGSDLTGMEDNRIDFKIAETAFEADPIGLSFFYEVHDVSGVKMYSDTFNVSKNFIEPDSTNVIPSLVFGGNADNYNVVSLPYQLTPNKLTNVFKNVFNQFGYDSTQWRIFHYQNTGTGPAKYIEYLDGLDVVEVGKSYWIIIRHEVDIFFEGAQSVDVSDGPFEITLNPGWNQIGNPYNFDVSWSDVLSANNNPATLGSFTVFEKGNLKAGTTLRKFRGGFIKNNSEEPLTIRIPFIRNAAARVSSTISTEIDKPDWELPITLTGSSITNELGGIGMHPNSSDGVDYTDRYSAPTVFPFSKLNFADQLSASMVQTQENYIWEFDVLPGADDRIITMNWANEIRSGERQLFLYDLNRGSIVNMLDENTYALDSRVSGKFRIYYGDERFVKENLKPVRSALGNPYPNPVSDISQIPFTIAEHDDVVRISVYNSIGQEVSVLLNGNVSPGFQEVTWRRGVSAPGVYFVRMATGRGGFESRKIVLD